MKNGSAYVIISDAGHHINMDSPHELSDKIIYFLK